MNTAEPIPEPRLGARTATKGDLSVLVVYHSKSGHTRQMAEFIARGADEVQGVTGRTKSAEDTTTTDLERAHGIIIGSPVYYGTMAAPVKQLFDRSVKVHKRLKGKVGAAFASAGSPSGGGETTVLDIVRAMLIHGMIVKGDPGSFPFGPVAVGAPGELVEQECLELGRRVAQLCLELF
jgi:NAD(P)H dehydrogenase (quinone)